jgi:hypothetical protein
MAYRYCSSYKFISRKRSLLILANRVPNRWVSLNTYTIEKRLVVNFTPIAGLCLVEASKFR